MNNTSEGDESPSPFHANVVVCSDYYTHLTIAQNWSILYLQKEKENLQ
nr:MAG TPA: hypothetical protein [Caudoviricetes sp.]